MSHLPFAFMVWLAVGLAALHRRLSLLQAPDLVLIDVAVESTDGRLESGLNQDAFEIVADGVTRPIAFFATGDRPLSLVLLLDVSASMKPVLSPDNLKEIVEKSFVTRLAPRDRARIGAISKDLFLSPQFTSNRRELLSAARTALDPEDDQRFGPSPVWDAAYAAVNALASADGRRAVLLVTDGRSTGNRYSPEEAGLHAMKAGVSVNTVGLDWDMTIPQGGTTGVRIRPSATLQWLAQATGGLHLAVARRPRETGALLERLLDDMRHRYTLGFEPPVRDGNVHKVEVRLKDPKLKARTRSLFLADKDKR